MIKVVFGAIFISIAAFIILVLASLGFGIITCNKAIDNVTKPRIEDNMKSNIKASIQQEVRRKSYLDQEWTVETNIWTKTSEDKIQTLEYHSIIFCKEVEIEKIKQIEYEKALPYLSKLNKLLEEDNNVKNK